MSKPTRYPEVSVAGSPREMGRQIGEACGEQIRGFCEAAIERVNLTTPISLDAALQVAHESIPYVESYSPDMLDELRGMGEAANVSLDQLMLLQVRNQLQADESGCTALAVGMPLRTQGLVAQNWDNDPALDEFTVVLKRQPVGKPALLNVTQAGLISYLGLNDAGIGFCVNSLPAPARRVGVPHYFTTRAIYESRNLDDAVDAVRRAERAIPANIVMSTPQGPADLEVTIDDVHVIRPNGNGCVTHTNHCEHPDLIAYNEQFPELIQSHARKTRIEQLLPDSLESLSIDDVQQVLRDHDNYPRSICRHSNDDSEHGFWETVWSLIIEPERGCLHLSRGNPCSQPYETYSL